MQIMVDSAFDIGRIAHELNVRAKDYAIGDLQTIRKTLRGNSRIAGSTIFASRMINPHWALHHGGRAELQFNIGLENNFGQDELRHGVAFSFQLSQSLPDIDVLIPKVRRFNEYLQLYPDQFGDMRMWHYDQGDRVGDYAPSAVKPELVTPGPFVFLGKRQAALAIDYRAVLEDFDRLLPLYLFVESGVEGMGQAREKTGFEFRAGCTEKASTATASLAERALNITLRHNLLQRALTMKLAGQFGAESVADELDSGVGTRIDVVLKRSATEFWYYEIKTSLSPRICIREAFGQILEYAFWPGAQEASRLIVCGESPLDEDGAAYLKKLNGHFDIPIAYEQITVI
jgi:hypothetical protein